MNNVLHLELASSVNLTAGEKVTISGLTGSNCKANPGQRSIVLSSSSAPVYNASALWNCDQGELVLTVSRGALLNVTYNVSFAVVNADCCRTTAIPYVSFNESCFVNTTLAIPDELEQQPLHTRCANFSAEISQTNRNPCDDNAINLTFTLNAPVSASGGSSIQIKGLGATLTGAGEIVIFGDDPVVGTACTLEEYKGQNSSCGNFTDQGVLIAPVRRLLDANIVHKIQFALVNSRSALAPASVVEMRFVSVCGLETFATVTEAAGPVLSPLPASFIATNIRQSTPWPGALNKITVMISSNVPLGLTQCNAKIVIDGFDGVCFKDGQMVPLQVNSSTSANVSGVFSFANRSVTFSLHDRFNAGENITLSFLVRNPSEAQVTVCVCVYAW